MVTSDDVQIRMSYALGHLMVPFSTKEEADLGADTLILMWLQMVKAYFKEKGITGVRPLQFLCEMWVGLCAFDYPPGQCAIEQETGIYAIRRRLLETLELVEDFESSDTTREEKFKIKHELKSRGLL